MTVLAFGRRASRARHRINPGLRQPLAIAGLVIVVLWVLIAIFAPLLAPTNPNAQPFTHCSAPRGSTCSVPTSSDGMFSAA